jgi:hypothetical protein
MQHLVVLQSLPFSSNVIDPDGLPVRLVEGLESLIWVYAGAADEKPVDRVRAKSATTAFHEHWAKVSALCHLHLTKKTVLKAPEKSPPMLKKQIAGVLGITTKQLNDFQKKGHYTVHRLANKSHQIVIEDLSNHLKTKFREFAPPMSKSPSQNLKPGK